jgi:hypothetical protein
VEVLRRQAQFEVVVVCDGVCELPRLKMKQPTRFWLELRSPPVRSDPDQVIFRVDLGFWRELGSARANFQA